MQYNLLRHDRAYHIIAFVAAKTVTVHKVSTSQPKYIDIPVVGLRIT